MNLIIAFIVSIFPVSWSKACDLNNCKDVQNYRIAQVPLQVPTNPTCEVESPIYAKVTEIEHSLKPTLIKYPYNIQFVHCVQDVMREIQKRRESDKHNILREIEQIKLKQIPKEQQMEMLARLVGEDSFYSYFKNQYDEGATQRPNIFYTFTGPALEMKKAIEGRVYENGVFRQAYRQSGIDILIQKENPVDFLIQRLLSENYYLAPISQDQNFTPGMSKLILFELIREFHHNKSKDSENYMQDFNNFAAQMQLGVIIPPSDFINDSLNQARFQYTINDGYFLGSKPHNMKPDSSSLPMSFDCSSFIQFCSFGFHSFNQKPPLKIVTSDFIYAYQSQQGLDIPSNPRVQNSVNQINSTYDIEPLTCETQLQRGDIVVYKGHMLVFDGYQENEIGQVKMKTIEAVGNQNRSLGVFTRDIYKSNCSGFLWERNAFSGKEVENGFVVRFKSSLNKPQQRVL